MTARATSAVCVLACDTAKCTAVHRTHVVGVTRNRKIAATLGWSSRTTRAGTIDRCPECTRAIERSKPGPSYEDPNAPRSNIPR